MMNHDHIRSCVQIARRFLKQSREMSQIVTKSSMILHARRWKNATSIRMDVVGGWGGGGRAPLRKIEIPLLRVITYVFLIKLFRYCINRWRRYQPKLDALKTPWIKRFGLNLFGHLQLIGQQNFQIDVNINICVFLLL